MDHETLGGRIPKGERRVRFADSMGMELVSIFLTDLFVLASHTPYTNYNQHRKPPSSRLSSTLQAIQYNHDHYHSNSNCSSNNNNNNNNNINNNYNINKKLASVNTSSNNFNNKLHSNIINNNNYSNNYNNSLHYNQFDDYHSNFHQVKKAISKQPLPTSSIKSSSSSSLASSPALPSSQSPLSSSSSSQTIPPPPTEFICEFTQPISLISFKERVKLKKVHLESCYINTTAGHVSVTCNIRVLNVSYDKSVSVRYTTDEWGTHTDSLASYKPGSCDGWSDQFTSTISIINKLQPGQRILFAVKFGAGSTVYWDNNGGLNYSVKSKCAIN